MLNVQNGEFLFVRLTMPDDLAGFTGATLWKPDQLETLRGVRSLMLDGVDEFLEGQPNLDLQRPSALNDPSEVKTTLIRHQACAVLGLLTHNWPDFQEGTLRMRMDYIRTPDEHLRCQTTQDIPTLTLAEVVKRAA